MHRILWDIMKLWINQNQICSFKFNYIPIIHLHAPSDQPDQIMHKNRQVKIWLACSEIFTTGKAKTLSQEVRKIITDCHNYVIWYRKISISHNKRYHSKMESIRSDHKSFFPNSMPSWMGFELVSDKWMYLHVYLIYPFVRK